MAMFSDILLTADFDGTLTAKNGTIPQRNLEAIAYFMENGGTFTVNTGRNLPMAVNNILNHIPMNAPFLFAEGCGVYDVKEGRLLECTPLPVDIGEIVAEIAEKYPYITPEIHCADKHYRYAYDKGWDCFNKDNRCSAWGYCHTSDIQQPILRLVLRARISFADTALGYEAKTLYTSTPEEDTVFQQIADTIEAQYGDQIHVFRANKWITTILPKNCSKLAIARKLQQQLGKKILICIGDAKNDLSMLNGADYAFCPADGAVAAGFPKVCPCAEGSVADLIYNKLPKILKENENGNLL